MNIAVIFAGRVGNRLSDFDKSKQFIATNVNPLIVRTVKSFQNHRGL